MFLPALRHRNFRLFFFGQGVSLIGTWMQSVAQSWLVYRLTDSSMLLGLVAFTGQIPVFLVSPIGGLLADRLPRRRILLWAQSAAMIPASLLAVLTLTDRVQVWHVFVLAAILGIVNGIDIPTRQSFVIEMVGREDLISGIGLNSSMFSGARVIGPAIAGALVATVGEGWCFALNAISFVPVLASLVMMKLPPWVPAGHKRSPIEESVEGFRFVARQPRIRNVLLLLGVGSFTSMPHVVLMPIFADRVLSAGAQGLGLLTAAAGTGAVLGALTLAVRKDTHGLERWIAAGAMLFGASMIAFSTSRVFPLSVVLLLPAGFFMLIQMSSSNTLIQSSAPDELRGRVMALYSMMFMGTAPLGSLLAGSLADRIGAPETVALAGFVSVAGGALYAWNWRRGASAGIRRNA